TSALARLLATLVVVQLLAGVINLALSAPLAMQLIHLLLADALWIVLVLVAVNVLAAHQREEVSV
ncbi:MAG: COX15/CtaA family protein, partial [Acidimicrobiia bacterium]|nr:COX15/CtaA family protein [Acidimicrobiia bacterium]